MKKLLAKYIGIYGQDIVRSTKIGKTHKFLQKSQLWTKEELETYQFFKLKQLLEHSFSTVPYYYDLFKKNGIHPNDIKNVNDFQKIPLLTKEIARQENKNLISKKIDTSKIKNGKTGGTTGIPLTLYRDSQTRSFTWGAFYRWYEWMDISVGDPVLVLWGAPEVLSNSLLSKIKWNYSYYFQNTMMINAFAISNSNLEGLVKKIVKFEPKIIRGYLSAILHLANYIELNNIKGIKPKAISTTSETLFPIYRQYLEKIFDAPVYDQYGCGECNSIAFECGVHNGLHICTEHVFLEVLNANNFPIFNNSGRIVVTDLDNYAMPFIRYENGDEAILTETQCSCGLPYPLISNIEGRSKDTIILKSGSRVHGVFFTDIFYELKIDELAISRFQVYQKTPGKIELRLESSKTLNSSLIELLKVNLDKYFDEVIISTHEKLENSKNGKFRYIISQNEIL